MNVSFLKDTAYIWRRLIKNYVSPYKSKLLWAVFCMTLTAITTAALAKFLEPIIDDVFNAKDMTILIHVGIGLMVLFIVKGTASYFESYLMNATGQQIICDIQYDLFSHLIKADVAFFHQTSSGELISKFSNEVNMLRGAATNVLTSIGKDSLTLLLLVSLMFYQDWFLAAITFVIFPTAVFPVIKIGRRMRKVASSTQQELGTMTSFLNEIFQGIRIVKAYSMEDYEKDRAKDIMQTIANLVRKAAHVRSITHPVMEVLGGIAVVMVISYGGYQVLHGNQTTGTFISFIAALLMAYEPMKRLANINTNLQEGLAAADRIFKLIDVEATIVDKKDAKPLKKIKGDIVFDHVSFSYTNSKKQALHDASFHIKPGQKVALVGASGAGKSTVFNLLLRLYDVNDGSVLIDGHDVRDCTLNSLRQNSALVSQEIVLFNDTIRANIAYGNLNATDKQIEQAAKQAAAHDFIMDLPEQYDAVVGENGLSLSGGQRQRIAIARAFLKNAPILLLDEATSALDTHSEKKVQEALEKLMEGRTTLIIAHRLATIKDVDLIFVLDKGRLVESGTHTDLIKKGGVYKKLAQGQLK